MARSGAGVVAGDSRPDVTGINGSGRIKRWVGGCGQITTAGGGVVEDAQADRASADKITSSAFMLTPQGLNFALFGREVL